MATPVIEAGDITTNGSSTQVAATIDYAAYSVGDLITMMIGTDGSTAHTIPTTGPNGDETIITLIANNGVGGPGGPDTSAFGFIATSAEAAGTLAFTTAANKGFTAASINTPAGEFDAANPYQAATGSDGSSAQDTVNSTPAWTSDATPNGRIVGFIAVDTDTISGTATGWTVRVNESTWTRVKIIVTTRDAANTASEAIAAADYAHTADTWTSIGFVINEPAAGTLLGQEISTAVGSVTPSRSSSMSGVEI